MNSQPETQNPDQIRSDIENTRQRMDNTMDAIGDRLHGRHLVDEIIGFFRASEKSSENNPNAESTPSPTEELKEKASSALSAVADSVKRNPVPALVIGAGLAWLIYESRRQRSDDFRAEDYEGDYPDEFDRPLNYPTPGEEDFEPTDKDQDELFVEYNESNSTPASGLEGAEAAVREKAHETRDIVHEKLQRAKEGVRNLGQRASEIGSRVQERTKEIYTRSRDRVVRTANEQPLAVGLGALALGIAVGLAIPTPQRVNRIAGPTADRLRRKARDTGRDFVERGKRVARAASDAAKSEAEKQGLTVEALRAKASGVEQRPPLQQPSQNQNPTTPASSAGQNPTRPTNTTVPSGNSPSA